MGIPGLTTYIAKRSEKYFEPFDLRDTYLVIDGCNLRYQLYNCTKGNSAFGGDYDEYAQCIRTFFKCLLECNVTPLVIIDGGGENRKEHTLMKRAEEKIITAQYYTPLSTNNQKFFPALGKHVYRNVLKEIGIRHVQCLFEADNEIAAVAKCLNCPVLSGDSDFYIYGVPYIPFNKLDITRGGSVNVKSCIIYRVESLLSSFPGLEKRMLPLVATLLGNDYVEQYIFKHFYQSIPVPRVGGLNYSMQQCRIEASLHWLSNHTLDAAIKIIISKVPRNDQKRIFDIIKMIIKEYTNTSTDILPLLGFSKEDIDRITSKNGQNSRQRDTNYLEIIEDFTRKVNITDIDESKSNDKTELEALVDGLPNWFIKEYQKALLPSYFMDILMKGEFVCSAQIEDYSQPSSVFISEKIISVIFTLLTCGIEMNSDCVKYLARGACNKLSRYPLKCLYNIFPFKIPSLHDLQNTSLTIRKAIFNITLGIEEQTEEFPINWRLYIATARFWIDHLTNVTSDSHIYALLFAMLRHVIDEKIGYYRSMDEFETNYKKKLLVLESAKKVKSDDLSYLTHLTITEALNAVEVDDCVLLAPYFINNTEMDQEHYTNPRIFNIRIVHLFALFQNCIEKSFSLNALLGFPYEVTSISDMYNGTLFYNLYNNFNKHSNIENYINSILECSPTLLQLFNIILIKAKLIFKMRAVEQKSPLQE